MGELKNVIENLKGMADAEAKKNRNDILRDMSDADNWTWSDGDSLANRIRSQKATEDVMEKSFEGLLALADQLDRIERKFDKLEMLINSIKK